MPCTWEDFQSVKKPGKDNPLREEFMSVVKCIAPWIERRVFSL